jgi:HSP20 family protein
MLSVTNPRRSLMHRPFRSVFDIWPWAGFPREFNREYGEEEWTPAMNVSETEKHYMVTFEVPGIDMKKTEILFRDGLLTVKGEKIVESETSEESVCTERYPGTFSRELRLTHSIKEDKIDATYKDGILKIVLPKSETTMPKKIVIH